MRYILLALTITCWVLTFASIYLRAPKRLSGVFAVMALVMHYITTFAFLS